MLISSSRHRPEDLSLWRELEGADRVHGQRLLRSGKVERSVAAVSAFLAVGPAYVGVSWGKESVATAHLVRSVAPAVPLLNLRCSNRNPDCDTVRNAYLARFASTYSEVPVDYGHLHADSLPSQELDRLTDQRWYAAISECGLPFGGRHITGIRAGESCGRRVRCCRWGENSPNGCAPLAWWTLADVFGYLAVHDLPTHPAYAMLGNGRWPRERLRVAEIGDIHGTGSGRAEWEFEYYGDVIRRLLANQEPTR